jgi:O-antigen/teichoic acid export membrane protein
MTQAESTVQRRLFSGGTIGLVSQGLNIGQSILMVPLILKFWDQETYGIWAALLATQTLFSCLDQGHQVYLGAAFNIQAHQSVETLRKTLGSAVKFTAIFGLMEVITVAVLGACGWLAPISGIDHEMAGRHLVNLSLLVLIINNIITGSLGGILVRLYTTFYQYVRGSLWGIALRLLQFLGMIGTVALGGHIFAVCIMTTVIQVSLCVAILIDLRTLFPEIYPWWSSGGFGTGARNFFRSISLTGTFLLEQASFNGVTLLVAHRLGPAVVPLFTTLRSVASLVYQGGGIVLQPLLPDLARYHVNKEPGKIMACIQAYWFAASVGVALALGFTPWAKTGYLLWTQHKLAFSWGLFICLFWSAAGRIFQTPLLFYFAATNALREQFYVSLARAAFTMLGVVVLLSPLGITGAGLALVCADVFVGLPLTLFLFRNVLRGSGCAFGAGTVFYGVGPTFVLGVVTVLTWHEPVAAMPWIIGGGCGLLLVFAVSLWRSLPFDVHQRALSLLAMLKFRNAP